MERLKLETPLTTALNVGRFVLDRLKGGAWSELPHEVQPATIHYFPDREEPEDIVA